MSVFVRVRARACVHALCVRGWVYLSVLVSVCCAKRVPQTLRLHPFCTPQIYQPTQMFWNVLVCVYLSVLVCVYLSVLVCVMSKIDAGLTFKELYPV